MRPQSERTRLAFGFSVFSPAVNRERERVRERERERGERERYSVVASGFKHSDKQRFTTSSEQHMTTETSPESAYPESKAVTGIQLDRL